VSLHWFSPLGKSSLRSIFQEQIINLILINNDKEEMIGSVTNYTRNVYNHILTFFKNLKNLSVMDPSTMPSYPGLSLRDLPSTTFSSPILTHLYINMNTFDDCLYLLDGRLRQLTTLCVTVYAIDKSSGFVHIMVSFYK
jgi:hypothetical protein